jgi:glyoxylase-like metal-dependent hydrolase (beta-lactamase superfamily II)
MMTRVTTSTATSVSPDSDRHWSEPGAWPVAPGVHRIPLPLPMDGLRAVNVYVIETGDGLTVVDGGWAIPESRSLLETSLAAIGRSIRDIRRFLVTHVHRDHYTQAVAIRDEVGSHVSLGLGDKATLDLIHAPGFRASDPYVGFLRRAGAHNIADRWEDISRSSTPGPEVWRYPDTWLDDDHPIPLGDRVLDAVHTPGHTQGHFVFADHGAGLLFAGDHVLPTITPSIGFEPALPADPLGDFLGSLTKVRGLPDLRLLPAHGPVADSSHRRIDELLAHHDHRLALCRAAVVEGGSTAYDVARELPWTRHGHAFDSLDTFNAALATMETRAHLELLVARGQLTASEVDSVVVYETF